MSLADRVPGNAELEADLRNTAMPHSVAARKHKTSESAVKRWRAKHGVSVVSPYADLTTPYPDEERPAPAVHKAVAVPKWQPGITITGDTAEIRTPYRPANQSLDDRQMLEEAGLNPDEWYITKTTQHVRYNESGDPELTQYWLRASKMAQGVSVEDMDGILAQYIVRHPAPELDEVAAGRIVMIPSGDLQLGKPEGGGTEATIERFARYTNEIAVDLADSGGVALLVLPWLGDCIEGLVSQGGKNIASLDIPITAQVRVYRRLMMHQLITLAPYAGAVLVPVVPGNHDQTIRDQAMPHTDSWAIEGASAAADYFRDRPGYEHISWAFPSEGEASIALQIDPKLTLGFFHGHSSGRSRPEQIIDWWGKQSHGRQGIGEADILVSAHWHHLRVQTTGGGRTWIQIPAMDGGSGWYRDKHGEAVVNGQITVDLTPGVGTGWNNLKFYA